MVTMSKKMKNIIIRVDDDEKNKIKKSADSCGLTISEFIRKSVLYKNPIFLSEDDRLEINDLKTELIKVIRVGNLYHDLRKQNQTIVGRVKSFLKKVR